MHTSSLFSRVSRYVRREFVDPGENRLTEVLAAVLERVPGLARALAVSWLDPDQHHAGRRERAASIGDVWDRIKILPVDVIPRVRTQVALAGRFVDLELRFALEGGARADDVVVLVEVKHGIEPHGGQLAAYRDALASMECQGAVVLLDHRRKLPYTDPAQVPAEVAQRSWESTGREIQRFPSPDGVSAWLCEELLTYLQEESLMDPTALGPEHLTALAYEGQAHAALAEICARAEGHVARLFAEPNRSAKRYGKGYEARWPRITTSTRDSEYAPWPEWHILANAGSRAIEIRAGLCIEKDTPFDAELERRLTAGIALGDAHAVFRRWQGPVERLMRVGRPQDVLVGEDLDAQGETLARWVAQTLQAVRQAAAPQ